MSKFFNSNYLNLLWEFVYTTFMIYHDPQYKSFFDNINIPLYCEEGFTDDNLTQFTNSNPDVMDDSGYYIKDENVDNAKDKLEDGYNGYILCSWKINLLLNEVCIYDILHHFNPKQFPKKCNFRSKCKNIHYRDLINPIILGYCSTKKYNGELIPVGVLFIHDNKLYLGYNQPNIEEYDEESILNAFDKQIDTLYFKNSIIDILDRTRYKHGRPPYAEVLNVFIDYED